MKIRIQYIAAPAIALAAAISSCESFTDIDQKGMNLLTKTSDLELLLNRDAYGWYADMGMVCGDLITGDGYLPTELDKTTKTFNMILTTWDEEAHATIFPALTSDDGDYESYYSKIGKVANPILKKVDEAEGPEDHKNRLRAEAYTIRAYYHFLVAQKYARPYNPATAETESCIPYLLETHNIQEPTVQETQKVVYTNILADLDRAIQLDCLPEEAINRERFCAAMPYAVKAHVLMAMQDYDGAVEAAKDALSHGDVINDYGTMLRDDVSYGGLPIKQLIIGPQLTLEEDYFTSCNQNLGFLNGLTTPYCKSMFEPGSYKLENYPMQSLVYKGMYDPEDPEKDRIGFENEMIGYYGVPFDSAYDMEGQNNMLGIKTTHMYLILAECALHDNDITGAMRELDKIRVKRINPDVYQPLENRVTQKDEAIRYIKMTCHGEHVYSMWNFFNRKRWTLLDDYKETLTRELCGRTFTLKPESDMWVFPIPRAVILQNPNLHHNYPTR